MVLFPTAEADTYNLVQSGRDYTIPATDGWFRFVGEAGVERIHMIASARPIPSIDATAGAGASSVAGATGPAGARPLLNGSNPAPVSQAPLPASGVTPQSPLSPAKPAPVTTAMDTVKKAQNQKSQAALNLYASSERR